MSKQILVTGATGYIGGRLVPELLKQGHSVRCLVRTPAKLDTLPWRDEVDVVQGDLSNEEQLASALAGIDTAYYLVHSLSSDGGASFSRKDRVFARTFRNACAQAGVEHIIYLGGLGDDDDPTLSKHLSSRHEVGEILSDGPVPVTELRAAVIIGSGSASFEMLRTVVEVLPAMITPRWVRTKVQPIAITDVLHYLVSALDLPSESSVIEIGGPEVTTYLDMMQTYARLAGLKKRVIVKVPFMTPTLSSHWLGLVTPLPTSLAKSLIQGLNNEVVVRDSRGMDAMKHTPITMEEAISRAIDRMLRLEVTTSWADAEIGGRNPADPIPTDPDWSGGTVLQDVKTVSTTASAHDVFATVTGIGGKRGWFVTDPLWAARGVIDKLVGGVGMRRGRRHPDELRVGDALDFWRVETLKEDTLLRLRAEMRLPGKAWLEWTIDNEEGKTTLKQWARFQPRGLAGRLYWYSLLPFHGVIFKGLANQIAYRAEHNLYGPRVTGRRLAPQEALSNSKSA